MESDISLIMDFDSDSDDSDGGNGVHYHHHSAVKRKSGTNRNKGLLSPPKKSGKLSGSDHGSIFSESDEDFCFVDTPTSTRVVSQCQSR